MSKNAKIICSNTLFNSFYSILDEIQTIKNDFFTNNIILVPDKFTLNAEKLFFEYTKSTSSFNVEIMSLTRLIKKITANQIRNFEVLNKNTSMLIITKILLDNSDKLGLIKNTLSPTLSEEFYETITQFKASGIMPNEIATNSQNLNFKLKLKDIQFVYEEYQKYISNGKLDSSDLVDIFINNLKFNENIKKTNIFVAMFDSFSFKQLGAIMGLAKYSKNFTIGLSATTKQNNKQIYINETLQQVLQALRDNGTDTKIENIAMTTPATFAFLAKNLFSYCSNPIKSNGNIQLIECPNEQEEIDFVARQIKKLVFNHEAKFSDINVASANFENYKQVIKSVFNEYAIPYYIDEQIGLNEHCLSKAILSLLRIVQTNIDKVYLLEYLKSPFAVMSSEEYNLFENYILEHGINYSSFLKTFKDDTIENIRKKVISPIENLIKMVKKCEFINDYIEILRTFLEQTNVKTIMNNIINDINFNATFQSQSKQTYDKILLALDTLSTILGTTKCSFEYFEVLINNLFASISIKTVPLGVDCVYVGDAENSTFYPNNYLFITGAIDGLFPNYKNDCGFISDTEIELLTAKNILSPTIRFTNKVKKYRIFELILTCKQQLKISFSSLTFGSASKPSEVFGEIKKIFLNKNGEKLATFKLSNEITFLEQLRASSQEYIFALGSYSHMQSILGKLGEKNKWLHSAKQLFVSNNQCNTHTLSIDAKQLFFPFQKTSVSQIERFFACPYQHFVNYGLRLKERKIYGVKNVDVGVFLHSIAEHFVNFLIENNYKYEKNHVYQMILSIAQEQFESVDSTEKLKINSLISEALKLCNKIFEQISNSDFKPIFTEKKFLSEDFSNKINITGKIDRIDHKDGMFLIFDYKTGSKNDFSFKDVYYGNKIQIVLYLSILESILNLVSAGAFYIPIKNKFVVDEKIDRYSGIFLNQTDLIKKIDLTLQTESKSKFYKIDFNKDGSLNALTNKNAVSPAEFLYIKNYVKDLFNNAVDEIFSGYIEPKPTKNVCSYCPFKLMCGYDIEKNGCRSQDMSITKECFKNLGDNSGKN